MSLAATVLVPLLGLLALFTFLSAVVLSLVWIERKFLGRIQMRLGPMRVGPFGLLQPVADAVKLVTKEDVMPFGANRALFWVAPLAMFIPAFMVWVTIPFARDWVIRNLELGLFYVVAVSVLSIVGLVMAGWSSANKYAVLGALRAAAGLISYEIPVVMVALAVAMLAGSLNLVEIVERQAPIYAVVAPLGALLLLFSGLAETGRTPFDIYHAESEVAGGPYIEYSGAHWAVFYLAEYVSTFALGVLISLLFLGGWRGPWLPPVLWLLIKAYAVILVIFWMRGTFPRLRIDQLMSLGWKVLVPLSFANILIAGVQLYYRWPWWALTLMSVALIVAVSFEVYRRVVLAGGKPEVELVPARELRRKVPVREEFKTTKVSSEGQQG
ncbi:MAG: NADH-quinone oxidoreductase subunit NuoH [Chloroflexi bacterium]|nr:NADH-quinone oxidoreductase subunit NuoH [Chloroflexota bacterium]